jgi:hypothetical protein
MFYKPKYCCNCGEKIERANWTIFSSRRFCELCETENKGYEYALRAFAGIAILIGLGGFATYLQRSAPAKENETRVEAAGLKRGLAVENRGPAAGSPKLDGAANLSAKPPQAQSNSLQSNNPVAAVENLKQRENPSKSSTETAFYCGAMTKKGTPCTRRVKTKGRCWQHSGQPSMTGFGTSGASK